MRDREREGRSRGKLCRGPIGFLEGSFAVDESAARTPDLTRRLEARSRWVRQGTTTFEMSDSSLPPPSLDPTLCAFEVELCVQKGPSAGQRHVLRQFPAFVGRGADVDVCLAADNDDRTLSRRHLRISVEGGRVVVADLSTNGTWIGQQHLRSNEPVPVQPDDSVWLGPRTMITLRLLGVITSPFDDAAPAVPPPVAMSAPAALDGVSATPTSSEGGLTLAIEVLGQTRVRTGNIEVQILPARKAMVLLVCLADGPPARAVSAERLIDLLWPDTLNDARAALQTTVSRLRRAFRASDPRLPDPIALVASGYRLSPAYSVALDARQLELLCEEAEQHRLAGRTAERCAALERAVGLYQGGFLEGHADDWVQGRRRSIEERYFDAVDALGEVRIEEGNPTAAIRLFERALEREPCREASMIGLMRGLCAAGRRDEALRRYGDFVRILKKQMGLSPGPQLLLLYETVRGSAGR